MSDAASVGLSAELRAWVEQVAGGTVAVAERRPGGGRHEAWTVDVELRDGSALPLFLRYDRGDPAATGDPFTLHREAVFYRALEASAVPVPRVLGVHPTEQAILSERVPGQPWFSRLTDEQQREAVASEFMTVLATLHAVDPHLIELPDQDADSDLRDLVQVELDRWESLYRFGGLEHDPLIEFGLQWLQRNVPQVSGPVVVVQGDTGPGNFLYENGRVTAVLDWELAHLGDPHDDLGWLALRAVQEPFTHLPDRLADYAKASGRDIDLDRLRYYRVFAELRVVVLTHRGRLEPDLLGEVGNALVYGTLHRRLLVEALADVMDVTVDPPAPLAGEPSDRDWLFEAALEQIKQIVVPRSTDAFVVLRSKGIARLLKYLREADRLAPAVEAEQLDDLAQLLGARPKNLTAGRLALLEAMAANTVEHPDLVRVFGRQVIRETQLLGPAMGVLADRHFDPLS